MGQSPDTAMSGETTFTRRWKRPSPVFVLIIAITVLGLVIAFALPRLILPTFANKPTTLVFQVRVVDDQGVPIPNANVCIGNKSGQTDLEGNAQVKQEYLAKGIKGLTGTCRLRGDIRVDAPGYISWQAPLPDLFGRTYDYVDKGTTLRHEIMVRR